MNLSQSAQLNVFLSVKLSALRLSLMVSTQVFLGLSLPLEIPVISK